MISNQDVQIESYPRIIPVSYGIFETLKDDGLIRAVELVETPMPTE